VDGLGHRLLPRVLVKLLSNHVPNQDDPFRFVAATKIHLRAITIVYDNNFRSIIDICLYANFSTPF